ncbi:hypothetical protein C2E25_17145 [Geothermobacter hydrogeniphilus]|uniref:Uncharacterized protein n=1 Tax=Geothermobacter hydrogeniphilus TaxID=1969733 RepID=A0A2K2H5B4_9BACT|nr:hypothetical protein [Geothermobacter hydrogeniphilus]PNU18534.1 hypothetical protein C2E25_17145 [Geothermobacter hydrogeniphilus]
MKTGLVSIFFLLLLGALSLAHGGCLTRDVADISGNIQTYFVCKNTLPSPDYLIASYMGPKISFTVFSFDKSGASYLCHDYESKYDSDYRCEKGGIRDVLSEYRNKKTKVLTYDIGDVDENLIKKIFKRKPIFATSETQEGIMVDKCFSAIVDDDVYLIYDRKSFVEFYKCLIRMEHYFEKNKKWTIKHFD